MMKTNPIHYSWATIYYFDDFCPKKTQKKKNLHYKTPQTNILSIWFRAWSCMYFCSARNFETRNSKFVLRMIFSWINKKMLIISMFSVHICFNYLFWWAKNIIFVFRLQHLLWMIYEKRETNIWFNSIVSS